MLALAVPVVLAELGWVTMGLVDVLMVGRLGAEAIGAVGIGSSIFMGVCVFAMGLLLGLDTLVSQSFGAGRLEDCHRWLVHGVVLALGLSIPVTALLYGLLLTLNVWGFDPPGPDAHSGVSSRSCCGASCRCCSTRRFDATSRRPAPSGP